MAVFEGAVPRVCLLEYEVAPAMAFGRALPKSIENRLVLIVPLSYD